MLVLSRKKGETIIINGDIEVIIAEIKGNEVRLGIKAPKSASIYRKEVYDKILSENVEAARARKDVKLPFIKVEDDNKKS